MGCVSSSEQDVRERPQRPQQARPPANTNTTTGNSGANVSVGGGGGAAAPASTTDAASSAIAGAGDVSCVDKIAFEDEETGEERVATADTLPGWRWGIYLRGVPHPSKWPEPLWLALEVLIVSNGLLALEDDVVCTPEVEARMAQAGIPGKIDVAGIPTGDNAAYLDALHATMARLVAMERLFLGDAQDDEAAPAVKPLSTAEGMDRSLTVKQARMFARSEHEHMLSLIHI